MNKQYRERKKTMKKPCKCVLTVLFCVALLLGICTISASASSGDAVIVGEGKTSIGPDDVSKYKSAAKIVVADGVTEIQNDTFYYFEMKSVKLPNSLITIGNSAFKSCKNLTEINIPDNVKTIGESAFLYCKQLKTVKLGKSLKTIDDDAFCECTALTEINIPESVTRIGFRTFWFCSSLNTVYYNAINCEDSGDTNGFFGSQAPITSLVIGSKVERIPAYAFASCGDLKSLTIPGNVKTIAKGAFCYCHSLDTAILEEGIQTIEADAFRYCDDLRNVTLPNSVTKLGENAFYYTPKRNGDSPNEDTADEKNDPAPLPQEGYWDELWLGLVTVFGGAAIVVILVLIVSLLASLTMNIVYLIGCVKITRLYCRKKQKSSGGMTALAVILSLLGLGFWYLLVVAILNHGVKEQTV